MTLVHVNFEIVVSGESLVTDGTPHALLMEIVELMFVVHVMIFTTNIPKRRFANVAFVNGFGVRCCQMTSQNGCPIKNCFANVAAIRTRA